LFKKKIVNQHNSGKTDQRCGNLPFNHDSTVDEPLPAAEHNDMNKNHIGRQNQGVEGFNFAIQGTKCQNSKIVQSGMSEEFSSFSDIQVSLIDLKERRRFIYKEETFVEEMVNQCNSEETVQRCENLTFNHDSTVDEPLVAAEHKDMNKNHIGRQSQDVKRNEYLFDEKSCLA
jgi:hypothetical protein